MLILHQSLLTLMMMEIMIEFAGSHGQFQGYWKQILMDLQDVMMELMVLILNKHGVLKYWNRRVHLMMG